MIFTRNHAMKDTLKLPTLIMMLLSAVLAGACNNKAEEKKPSGPPAAIITVTQAQTRDVPVIEHALGEIDGTSVPKVAAEVGGRITRLYADVGDAVKAGQVLAEIEDGDYRIAQQAAQAEVARLEALLANQARLVERYRELVKKEFLSPLKMEETEAQHAALVQQLAAASAQQERAGRNLQRTRVIAPIAGRIDQRLVSQGDWIELGKPVFQIASSEALRVRLPFPENVAARIKPGQTVALATPTSPDKPVQGVIAQLRPQVGSGSRSFDAIVVVKNPGDWKPGASVDGGVTVETRAGAVTLPETSVVLRPAGTVVYVVANGKAMQRVVRTGAKAQGQVEILEGVAAGETVALDGAGFLTDQAAVTVKAADALKPSK